MQGTDESNVQRALQYVDTAEASGGTEIYTPLQFAFSLPNIAALYLLADAEVGEQDELITAVRSWSKQGQVPCHTTAFEPSEGGQRFLQDIASATVPVGNIDLTHSLATMRNITSQL
jgi:hypothetical protein